MLWKSTTVAIDRIDVWGLLNVVFQLNMLKHDKNHHFSNTEINIILIKNTVLEKNFRVFGRSSEFLHYSRFGSSIDLHEAF